MFKCCCVTKCLSNLNVKKYAEDVVLNTKLKYFVYNYNWAEGQKNKYSCYFNVL